MQGEVKIESGGRAQGVESEIPIAMLRRGGLIVERGRAQPLKGVRVLDVGIYAEHKVRALKPRRLDSGLVNPGEDIYRERGALGLNSLKVPSGNTAVQNKPERSYPPLKSSGLLDGFWHFQDEVSHLQ